MLVHNSKRSKSRLRIDPTRTTLLRQRFVREMDKGFNALKKAIIQLVEKEDAFGLAVKSHDPGSLVVHTRYQALTTPQQLEAFKQWVQGQVDQGILKGVDTGAPNWLQQYIQEAYEKGTGRSFDDYMAKYKEYYGKPAEFYQGTKEEFLRSSFRRPASVERVQLLASRAYTDLKGVTEAMSTRMNRVLTDSIIQGRSPQDTARALTKEVEGIGRNRARTIARTETIRAHADGQLDALKNMGVEEVGVMVEWSTASDDLVCDLCADMDGAVLRIQDAGILIPRHPNCRCAWLPANVGEDPKRKVWYGKDDKGAAKWQDLTQKRGADAKAAIDKSIKDEIPKGQIGKRTLDEQKEISKWVGADREKLLEPLKSPLDGPILPPPAAVGPSIAPVSEVSPTAPIPTVPTLPENLIVPAPITEAERLAKLTPQERLAERKVHLVRYMEDADKLKKTDIEKVIVEFDKAVSQITERIPAINGKFNEVYLEVKKGKVFSSSAGHNCMGTYNESTKELRMASSLKVGGSAKPKFKAWGVGNDMQSVSRHEYGHHFHRAMMNMEGRIRFNKLVKEELKLLEKAAKPVVSQYAKTNVAEMFAESFSAYTHPNYSGGLPAAMEKFFSEIGQYLK